MRIVTNASLGIASLIVCLSLPVRAETKGVPALQRLADKLDAELGEALRSLTATEPEVAVMVEADGSILGREGRIVQELERLLVYRLESGVMVGRVIPLGAGGENAVDRARASGASLLLRCVLGVENGIAQVTADLTPIHVPFWDRLVDSSPRGAKAHLFVSTEVDDEIVLLLGKSKAPPTSSNWRMTELLYWPQRVLDLGIGDLNGDLIAELILLTEGSIDVFSLEQSQPKPIATYDLSHLPDSRARTRDPVGSLQVFDFNQDGQAEIFYKLANRGVGEILSFSGGRLRSLRDLGRMPLCVFRKNRRAQMVTGAPEPGTNRFLPEIEVADINESRGRKIELPAAISSLRCSQLNAEVVPWMTFIDTRGRMYRLDAGFLASLLLADVGAAAIVLDFDQDGEPEWILSDPVWPGEADSLRIFSHGTLVWQTREVVGSIVAIAGGILGRQGVRVVLGAVEVNGTSSRIYLVER